MKSHWMFPSGMRLVLHASLLLAFLASVLFGATEPLASQFDDSFRRRDLGVAENVFLPPRGGRGVGAALSLDALRSLEKWSASSPDRLVRLNYAEFLRNALLLTPSEQRALKVQVAPLQRFSEAPHPSSVAMLDLEKVGGRRLFHAFVLFTVSPDAPGTSPLEGQCQHCESITNAFRDIALAFNRAGASSTVALPPSLLPVFFLVVDVVSREGAGISSVLPSLSLPAVLHLGPGLDGTELGRTESLQNFNQPSALLSTLRQQMEGEAFLSRVRDEDLEASGEEGLLNLYYKRLLQALKKAGMERKVIFLQPPRGSILLFSHSLLEAGREERLYSWIADRSSWSHVPFERQGESKSGLTLLFVEWLPALLPFLLYLLYCLLLAARRLRWLIPTGAVTVFTSCISGLVYSIVNKVKLFALDPTGLQGRTFFTRSMRSQYLLEGLAMAVASTGISLAAAALLKIASMQKLTLETEQDFSEAWQRQRRSKGAPRTDDAMQNEKTRSFGKGRKQSLSAAATGDNDRGSDENNKDGNDVNGETPEVSSAAPSVRRRRFAAALTTSLFLLMLLLAGLVLSAFRLKVAWSNPTFFPPSGAAQGPLRVDRGNLF